jgi:hypothetical protein
MSNPTIIQNFRLDAALAYAAIGWRVIPLHYPIITANQLPQCSCRSGECSSIGKHPLTVNGLKDASTDEAVIREWWVQWPSANIGIATGADSGIIVLDVDPRDGGIESLAALMDEIGHLPESVESQTGSGGMHVVFAHPGVTVRNSAGKLGAGLDIRGDGGYIVAPPSLHASGQRYLWKPMADPTECQLASMPDALLARLRPAPVQPPSEIRSRGDAGCHWLGKALAKVGVGNRNDTGYWLACQLRDADLSESEAAGVMRDYAERVPRGDKPYTEREALATLRSAYSEPKRELARSQSFAAQVIRATPPPAAAPHRGAAAELHAYFDDVVAGRIANVPFPWLMLTKLANSLVPESIVMLCADPGVGKTFFVLQCLQYWHDGGHNAAALFLEKDRKFYTRRLLAQLERRWELADLDWCRQNPAEVNAALAKNAGVIDALGKHIHTADGERVTLDRVLNWIRQMASAGKRVIVVDPITNARADDRQRWNQDDDFMQAAAKIVRAHGASLILTTHPKKAKLPTSPSGHDMAAGAAYYRFSDSLIWLHKTPKPKCVRYITKHGPTQGKFDLFVELKKTRDGKGSGAQLAYCLSEGGVYKEKGIVDKEIREQDSDGLSTD